MTDIYMHMDSQRESKLVSVPAEILQAIYDYIIPGQVHAFLSQGKIHLSLCLQPNLGDDQHDGRERRPKGEESSEDQWARHLRSSWGPHWECEKVAFAESTDLHEYKHNTICDLLLVCKKMFLDIRELMAKTTAINITDLDTLDVLLLKPRELSNSPHYFWNLWNYISPHISRLNIALRLPLAFFRVLEEEEALVLAASHRASIASTAYTNWVRLWAAVSQLQQLRSLYIWLDHDDPSSWSVLNERLALHRVITVLTAQLQARSKAKALPQVDITFNLPKLHPRKVRPDTHFIHEDIPSTLPIERRFRQRYYCEVEASGNLSVKHNPDFPLLYYLPEFYKEEAEYAGRPMPCPDSPPMKLEEVEKLEIKLWDEGTSIGTFELELSGFRVDWGII